MTCIIVEDERPAAERLRKMVEQHDATIEVVALTDSVASTVAYLSSHPHPDFMLMDIQLGDGISFEILDRIAVTCPIIFTTAFNEYAIRAFKVNSIDYLLKPIDKDELEAALRKLKEHIGSSSAATAVSAEAIAQAMRMLSRTYKERFVTRIGDKLHMLPVSSIAAFASMEKATYAYTLEGKMMSIDHTLDQIEGLIDPSKFFRISRKHIVALSGITDVVVYSSSRLKLNLKGVKDDEVIVSREKCGKFKEWLDR
jgi:DNA-binding LytR/AlgR family response regulator